MNHGEIRFHTPPVLKMEKVACCLSLMRRLPPGRTEQNLSGLLNLVPESTEELLQRIDQPLEEMMDSESVS